MYMQQLAALNPRAKLEKQQEKLKQSRERLENRIQLKFKEYEHQLHLLLTRLHGNAPTAKLVGGFGYLESEGKPVMSAGQAIRFMLLCMMAESMRRSFLWKQIQMVYKENKTTWQKKRRN